MEELLALLGLGGGGLLVGNAYNQLGDTGDLAWNESQRIGQDAADLTSFQGYGVTGPTGSAQVSDTGDVRYNLSPDQQAFQGAMYGSSLGAADPNAAGNLYGTQAYGTAQSLLGNVAQGSDGREQEYYNKIRAMQTPEEQRQRLGLETRLMSQGRTGLHTAAYGGAPEQLALAKAQEEAQNTAAYQAIELARQSQLQDAQISSALSGAAGGALGNQGNLSQLYGMLQYAPQNAMLDAFTAGSQAYGYEDIARRQAANQLAEAQMGGLEGLLGANLGQANLMGQVGTGLIGGSMGMLSSAINNGADTFGDIWDNIKGVFS